MYTSKLQGFFFKSLCEKLQTYLENLPPAKTVKKPMFSFWPDFFLH